MPLPKEIHTGRLVLENPNGRALDPAGTKVLPRPGQDRPALAEPDKWTVCERSSGAPFADRNAPECGSTLRWSGSAGRGFEILRDESQQILDHAGIQRVLDMLPLPLIRNQVRGLERVQVKTEGAFAHAEFFGQLASRERAITERGED